MGIHTSIQDCNINIELMISSVNMCQRKVRDSHSNNTGWQYLLGREGNGGEARAVWTYSFSVAGRCGSANAGGCWAERGPIGFRVSESALRDKPRMGWAFRDDRRSNRCVRLNGNDLLVGL